ncbi:MAG: cytochrome c [Rubrivivax sp.]|nr:cytochrome c [Rubrivivax sp.]
MGHPVARWLVSLALSAAAAAQAADARLERGRYLVQGIVACGNCHTPQGPNGPLPGMELAGGLPFPDQAFMAYSANLTPDKETGLGKWTDAQIVAAIREGRRPDGSLIGPPMPIELYRDISDDDALAIVAYLRSVPAVKNSVPKSEYHIPLPPNYGPPVGKVVAPSPADKLAWGAYLAGPLGHCVECHSTPGPHGAGDRVSHLGAGGMKFDGPWGTSIASNITPTGLKRYSDADLVKVIATGVRPDGSRLKPPMGTSYYAHMNKADLEALVAYLRSLPPK